MNSWHSAETTSHKITSFVVINKRPLGELWKWIKRWWEWYFKPQILGTDLLSAFWVKEEQKTRLHLSVMSDLPRRKCSKIAEKWKTVQNIFTLTSVSKEVLVSPGMTFPASLQKSFNAANYFPRKKNPFTAAHNVKICNVCCLFSSERHLQ